MNIYLVGGAVRDQLLGLPIRERDWVVVGATAADLLAQGFRQVGKDFPVFLHPQSNEEYALARRETKVAPGYTGFICDISPEVSLHEDLLRRDLTINAMAQTADGKLIDPYQGLTDLNNKVLRHVSPAFAEDPVRILRIARFAARFATLGFTVAPETRTLMQQIVTAGELHSLVAERVWKEIERALGEQSPLEFFIELANCQALTQLWPFLDINGAAATALTKATAATTAPVVRFAALTHAITVTDLNFLSKRYRVPKVYRSLAYIIIKYYKTMLNFTTLSATAIVEIFIALDAFRRYERFLQFLECCQVLANVYNKSNFRVDYVMQAYVIAKPVNVSALLKHSGSDAMAAQIKAQRISALTKWLNP